MLNIPSAIVDLLKSDSVHKNFRVHFPNGEHTDLTNSDIVQESVTLNESICSGSQLKLGVCETPSLEFETIGVGKIKGYLIECYMEVECPSTVTDAVYRSDIEMWVYPIPYGVFVVDSCKKQADMTHRKIVAYNKAGYTQWQFNKLTTQIFNLGMYWYTNGLKVSLEGILKLIMPNMGANFQEPSVHLATGSIVWERESTQGNTTERWYVLANYNEYDYPAHQSIHYFKTVYDEEFINKIVAMKNYITSLGFDTDDAAIWLKDAIMINDLKYTQDIGTYYVIRTPDDMLQSVWLPELGNPFQIKQENVFAFASLDINEDIGEGHWTNYGFSSSLGEFEAVFVAFKRLRLYHRITRESEIISDDLVMDTNESTPHLYTDANAASVSLFQSLSNLYINIPSKKKTVNMPYQTGGSGYKTKTLYKYDFSTLLNIDPQKIIEAYCELNGKFGLIKRNGQIEFVSVNDAFTTPDENIPKSQYSSLWYDDDMSLPYGRIAVNYTNTSNEKVYTYYDIYDDYSPDKYKLYDISNNFFIQQNTYTEQQIQTILQNMASNIDHISYMPIDLEMKGRPDLQAGDVIIIESDEEDITGFIMQRTISGIQGLIDNIKAQDDVDNDSGIKLNGSYDEESGVLTLYTS